MSGAGRSGYPRAALHPRAATGPLVLVVEDNPEMSRFIAQGLADTYRVATAFDGKEGLDKAIELKPDIILTDIMMPAMGGDEMIEAIRKRQELSSIPVVLVTAKADDDLRIKLLRHGAQDYLTKPFELAELHARVDNLVAKKVAEEALLVAQRLRDEWISIVAHDLRQPVSVITAAAFVLPKLLPENTPPNATALLERVARGASALDRMVRDLLDASRVQARHLKLEKTEVDMVSLLTEVIERTPETRRRCSVRFDRSVAGQQILLQADAGRIEQVMGNLLSNAVKYAEAETQIEVTMGAREHDVEVCVMSRGNGIAPADLPHVFERFRRAVDAHKSDSEGLGIGLYICEGLVEAHGGRIWAESIPGDITSFHFTLPRTSTAQESSATATT